MGFIATASDSCVFIKGMNIVVLYVDDCIIISRDKVEANKLCKAIKQQDFTMIDKGTMEQYLGMKIENETMPSSVSVNYS